MIQFSKPRRALNKSMEQFRRHDYSDAEATSGAPVLNDGENEYAPPFLYLADVNIYSPPGVYERV
jgi:hypothetical protein